MSHVIPNSFQTPNAHVDRAMMHLTGDEYKVLNFAVRHIFGWQDKIVKRQGEISLSRFLDGFITEDGTHFGGVGLGRPTLINILKTLVAFGLLVKVGVATANGQTWSIGIAPDWAAMEQRHAEMKLKRRDKTAKATVASIVARTTSTSDDTGNVTRTEDGTSDDTAAGTSDDTHINPLLNPPSNPSIAPTGADDEIPEDEPPKPKNLSEHQLMSDAIVQAFGWDWKTITPTMKSHIGKVARELREAQAKPHHIQGLYEFCDNQFDGITPAALSKHWAAYVKEILNGKLDDTPDEPAPAEPTYTREQLGLPPMPEVDYSQFANMTPEERAAHIDAMLDELEREKGLPV